MQMRAHLEDEKLGFQNMWCLLPGFLSNKSLVKQETQGPSFVLCDMLVESATMKLFCSRGLFVNILKVLDQLPSEFCI